MTISEIFSIKKIEILHLEMITIKLQTQGQFVSTVANKCKTQQYIRKVADQCCGCKMVGACQSGNTWFIVSIMHWEKCVHHLEEVVKCHLPLFYIKVLGTNEVRFYYHFIVLFKIMTFL